MRIEYKEPVYCEHHKMMVREYRVEFFEDEEKQSILEQYSDITKRVRGTYIILYFREDADRDQEVLFKLQMSNEIAEYKKDYRPGQKRSRLGKLHAEWEAQQTLMKERLIAAEKLARQKKYELIMELIAERDGR